MDVAGLLEKAVLAFGALAVQLALWGVVLFAVPGAAVVYTRRRLKRDADAAPGVVLVVWVCLAWLAVLALAMSRLYGGGFGHGAALVLQKVFWFALWTGLILGLPLFVWQIVRGAALATKLQPGKGHAKVAAGAIAGLLLFAGFVSWIGAVPTPSGSAMELGPKGLGVLGTSSGFEPERRAGIYVSVDNNLQTAVGERALTGSTFAYQDQNSTVNSKQTQITILTTKILPLNAAAYSANETYALSNDTAELRQQILDLEPKVQALREQTMAQEDIAYEATVALADLDGQRAQNITALFANDPPGTLASAQKQDQKVASLLDTVGADQLDVANKGFVLTDAQAAVAQQQANVSAAKLPVDVHTQQAKLDTMLATQDAATTDLNKSQTKLATDQGSLKQASDQLTQLLDAHPGSANLLALEAKSRTTREERNTATVEAAKLARDRNNQTAQLDALWAQALANDSKATVKAINDLRKAQVDVPQTIRQARRDMAVAQELIRGDQFRGDFPLASNHALYLKLKPYILSQDDAKVKALVADAAQDDRLTNPGDLYAPFSNIVPAAFNSYNISDRSVGELHQYLLWFVFPWTIGVLLAPMVLAQGSILNSTFEESDTVGFKKYPTWAAFLVLLLGAFGAPAFWFGAWAFKDIRKRADEGQIAL